MAYDCRKHESDFNHDPVDLALSEMMLERFLLSEDQSPIHRILIDLSLLSRLEQHYLFSLEPRGSQ